MNNEMASGNFKSNISNTWIVLYFISTMFLQGRESKYSVRDIKKFCFISTTYLTFLSTAILLLSGKERHFWVTVLQFLAGEEDGNKLIWQRCQFEKYQKFLYNMLCVIGRKKLQNIRVPLLFIVLYMVIYMYIYTYATLSHVHYNMHDYIMLPITSSYNSMNVTCIKVIQ